MEKTPDRELGMQRKITRRDFLDGVALAIGGSILSANVPWLHAVEPGNKGFDPEKNPNHYPPALLGMRGNHPGSFEVAHRLRDGTFWESAGEPEDTGEKYDLVVVGGGISGLAAAYFYRQAAGSKARVLILDNHDDFGGHAKRNEFVVDGHTLLINGGTMLIDSPRPYGPVPAGLLKDLGIDPKALAEKYPRKPFDDLGSAVFFDKATFGADRLVKFPSMKDRSRATLAAALAQSPLPQKAQEDIARV
jgi:spermidine dehydrogenase